MTDHVWWNEGLQKLFGYSKDETGSGFDSWKGRVYPEDLERVEDDLALSLESGRRNWAAEYRFRRRDGSYAFVIDRGYVVYNDDRPIRMIGSMMDVTDGKSLE